MTRSKSSNRPAQEEGGGLRGREKTLWLAGVLLLLLSFVVGVVVVGGGNGNGNGAVGGNTAAADGVLTEVEPDRLRLRLSEPVDGREEIDFVVRPDDAVTRSLISHLEVHVRDRLPTRINYEREGDTYVSLSVEDAP